MTPSDVLAWAQLLLPLACSWPIITAVLAFVFRKPLAIALQQIRWPSLSSLKMPGGIEFGFRDFVTKALETAQANQPPATLPPSPHPIPALPPPQSPSTPTSSQIAAVNALTQSFATYLLQVANRKLTFIEHTQALEPEINSVLPPELTVTTENRSFVEFPRFTFASGYLMALFLNGVRDVFTTSLSRDNGQSHIELRIEPSILLLLAERAAGRPVTN